MTEAARPEDNVGGENATPTASPEPQPEPAAEPERQPGPPSTGFNIDDLVTGVDWTPHVEQLARWRQGHQLVGIPVLWLAPPGTDPITGVEHRADHIAPVFDETGYPWIITTQTCDLGGTAPGDRHPFIELAPVVHASTLERNRVRLARDRQTGDLVPVRSPFPIHEPAESEKPEWFADLRLEVPISKTVLLDRDPIDGFATQDEYIAFAEMLGYKKRRPALHAALAEDLPRLLDKFVTDNGVKKQCFAKVEQVRLLITDQRLNPAAAAIYIITNGVALTDDETEIWNRFQAQASTMLKAHGIDARPAIHCDVSDLKASVYRVTVPVPSAQLTALRFQ
jgi:hypothetical protein